MSSGPPGRPPFVDTLVLAVGPSLAPADAARLAARLRALPRGAVVVCDVSALTEVDLAAVEALARLRLAAGRGGHRVVLRGASARLRELLALTGLEGVLALGSSRPGRPKSGKRRSVSRKELSPVIRPSEISRTWSAHGSGRRRPLGRYWANAGRAVRPWPAPGASPRQPMPVPRHQRADVVGAAQPQLVRRHGQGGVLVQQRGERVHVVALEGVDVAGQQRALRLVHRAATGSVARARRSRPSVARARCSALLTEATVVSEQLGDLARLPGQHLAQDQHRPLPGRQVLQRGDERQPDRLPGDRRPRPGRRRRQRPGRRAPARARWSPAARRRAAARPSSGRAPGPSGGPGAALPFSMSRQTLVAMRYSHDRSDDRPSNRSKPRQARTIVSWTASSASKAEPEHPVAVAGQLDPVPLQPQRCVVLRRELAHRGPSLHVPPTLPEGTDNGPDDAVRFPYDMATLTFPPARVTARAQALRVRVPRRLRAALPGLRGALRRAPGSPPPRSPRSSSSGRSPASRSRCPPGCGPTSTRAGGCWPSRPCCPPPDTRCGPSCRPIRPSPPASCCGARAARCARAPCRRWCTRSCRAPAPQDSYARLIGRSQAAGTTAVLAATALAAPVLAAGGYRALGVASAAATLLGVPVALVTAGVPGRRRAGAGPGLSGRCCGRVSARCGARRACGGAWCWWRRCRGSTRWTSTFRCWPVHRGRGGRGAGAGAAGHGGGDGGRSAGRARPGAGGAVAGAGGGLPRGGGGERAAGGDGAGGGGVRDLPVGDRGGRRAPAGRGSRTARGRR